jgi:hypothetical protein
MMQYSNVLIMCARVARQILAAFGKKFKYAFTLRAFHKSQIVWDRSRFPAHPTIANDKLRENNAVDQ